MSSSVREVNRSEPLTYLKRSQLTINSKWREVTEDNVLEFKNRLVELLNLPSNRIRVSCIKEWFAGTFIDIYIEDANGVKTHHLA